MLFSGHILFIILYFCFFPEPSQSVLLYYHGVHACKNSTASSQRQWDNIIDILWNELKLLFPDVRHDEQQHPSCRFHTCFRTVSPVQIKAFYSAEADVSTDGSPWLQICSRTFFSNPRHLVTVWMTPVLSAHWSKFSCSSSWPCCCRDRAWWERASPMNLFRRSM